MIQNMSDRLIAAQIISVKDKIAKASTDVEKQVMESYLKQLEAEKAQRIKK